MYLECPEQKGKFLSVNLQGELSCKDIEDPSTDKVWNIIEPKNRVNDGFFLVSNNYKFAIDYIPNDFGEEMKGRFFNPSSKHHTLWNISDDSEIYTFDENGDKRYLWLLMDKVFVTPDENIAEKWTPVSLEGYQDFILDTGSSKDISQSKIYVWLWFFMFLLVLYLIFIR